MSTPASSSVATVEPHYPASGEPNAAAARYTSDEAFEASVALRAIGRRLDGSINRSPDGHWGQSR